MLSAKWRPFCLGLNVLTLYKMCHDQVGTAKFEFVDVAAYSHFSCYWIWWIKSHSKERDDRDVTGHSWHHKKVILHLMRNQSVPDTQCLSHMAGCTRQYGPMTILSLYWESLYQEICFLRWNRTQIRYKHTLIARFMGPTWGPSGAARTQLGPMLAPWTCYLGIKAYWDSTFAI